jgi:hypothetical protein
MRKAWFLIVRAFAVNLLAAYAPALLWRPWENVGHGGDGLMLSVFSPVAFPMLLGMLTLPSGSTAACTTLAVVLLGLFLLALLALSICEHRSMLATLIGACVLFGVSFAQGTAFSSAIHGLDAIGHSQGKTPSRAAAVVTSSPSP